MHSILHCQHGLLIAGHEEPLEKTPSVECLQGVGGVSRGRQLVLISNEDDSLRIQVKGDQARWLCRLASFINYKVVDDPSSDLKSLDTSH